MWHMQDGMGWWMVFGSVLWILFIIALIFALSSAIRSFSDRNSQPEAPHRDSALEIARQRYASGDITREEFEQIRDDLRRGET